MKIRVNPHTVEIVREQTEPINEKEIKKQYQHTE